MLDTMTIAIDSEHVALLDEQALTAVAGGEGVKDWLAKQIGGLLFDCIADSLDAIISAAQEGYEDAR